MKKKRAEEKKEGFSFSREYSKSWEFIKESKNFIWAIIIIFFFFFLVGFFVPLPQSLLDKILNFIRELVSQTEGLDAFGLIKFIFVNNLWSSFNGILFGFFLGILPIFSAISNGFILGFVASLSVGMDGILSLWRILPHGIFELPAILISLGLGLRIGTFIFKKEKMKSFVELLFNSIRVFIFIIIPLLIIAAIIEGSLIFLLK